jgi:hypothetical protein
MTWTLIDPEDEPTPPTVYGVEKGAELRVEVHTYDDGERVVMVQCLCAACHVVDEIGVEDGMDEGLLAEGIHYLEWWHEEYRTFEFTEHDVGLRHTRVEEEKPKLAAVAEVESGDGTECAECQGTGGWTGPVDNTDIDVCSSCGGTGIREADKR